MEPRVEVRTPEWVKDAVFNQIFPDRFACSGSVPKPSSLEPWDTPPTIHGFKGGDLVGIAKLNASQQPLQLKTPAGSSLPDGTLLRDVWRSELAQVVRGTISADQIPARQGRVWLVVEAASEAGQGQGLRQGQPRRRSCAPALAGGARMAHAVAIDTCETLPVLRLACRAHRAR